MKYKHIYGPVSSWRLGRSLGVDPVYTGKGRICPFDCVYCQVGCPHILIAGRKVFVPAAAIAEEIKNPPYSKIDYITFSGAGEPTLAKNLGDIIKKIRKIRNEKIAVLTNSALMDKKDVRGNLALADYVIAKLDAHSQKLFDKVNRPAPAIKFSGIVKALAEFRALYRGKFALQIMFVKENKPYAEKIAHLARKLGSDEIQLNTPLRPCAVKPLSRSEMDRIKKFFKGTDCVSVYDAKKGKVEHNVRYGHSRRGPCGPHRGHIRRKSKA